MPSTSAERIRSQLSDYSSSEVIQAIAELGARNTQGLLRPLEYDATKPYHDLSNVLAEAHPLSNEQLAPLGPEAHPGFAVIQKAWAEHHDMLSFLAGSIRYGNLNFTLVTNHSNVIDIGLVLGALRLELDPWLSGEDFSNSSGLVISRGIVATQVAFGKLGISLPTVEVLQYFTNVFFSFPTTSTVRSKNFPRELVRLSNDLTKLELDDFLKPGGRVLAIAPSASKDQFFRERIHMQPLKNGTMELMKGWVIPVAVTLDGPEPPACKVLPWRFVNSYEDCHDTMREIAKECSRQTLVNHIYHDKPSLFEEAKAGIAKLRKD